jgi:hypothetical protein
MEKPAHLRSVPAGRAAKAQALPRQLEAVRERSVKALMGKFHDFLDGMDDKLFDLADGAAESERNMLLDAMREMRIKRSGAEARFQQELMGAFDVLGQKPGGEEGEKNAPSLENLTLVNDDELEVDVAIDNMARRARNGCDEQLRALNHRIEHLFETRFEVTESNGPLEPRQIGKGFRKSMETLEVDIRTRLMLFKLFEREVLSDIGHVVSEANQQLIDAGVLSEMKAAPIQPRTPRRTATSRGGDSSSGVNLPSAGLVSSVSGEGESPAQMFSLLQEMMSAMRTMAATATGVAHTGGGGTSGGLPAGPANMAVMQDGVAYVGGAPVAAGTAVHSVSSDDLLGVLNRLQRVEQSLSDSAENSRHDEVNVKEELSTLLEAENEGAVHALDQADDDVINLVSMLFDFILDDQALSPAIKAFLGRLQIPLLKVAISDKDFFTNEEHAARQLLNALARAGAQWSPSQGTEDPLYKLVERSVYRVLDDYDLDTSLFDELLQEVNEAVLQQAQQSERIEARVREVEEGRAQAELANTQVDGELDKRLAGRDLPDIAVRILREAWRQVLYLTFLREGQESEAWKKQLKVADAVVWSLLPHAEEAERERLKALSPRLITSLDQGLLAINYDAVERQTLMAALRQAHMQLLQGQDTQREKVTAAVAPPVQPDVVLPADSPLIRQMKGLTSGQWLELGTGEDAQRCKLAANIRQGSKLVFINRRGVKVAEFSAIELADKVYKEEARVLEGGALFDRALESVINDLRSRSRA